MVLFLELTATAVVVAAKNSKRGVVTGAVTMFCRVAVTLERDSMSAEVCFLSLSTFLLNTVSAVASSESSALAAPFVLI